MFLCSYFLLSKLTEKCVAKAALELLWNIDEEKAEAGLDGVNNGNPDDTCPQMRTHTIG